MTVKWRYGDIFDTECEAIVNPVNCVGVMGKGLARVFREKFPVNYREYQMACRQQQVVVGRMFVTVVENDPFIRRIINFPTKHHWSKPSEMRYIEEGLESLREIIMLLEIRSIAIPALGCGCGGLPWDDVAVMVAQVLKDLDDVHIELYVPEVPED